MAKVEPMTTLLRYWRPG